MNLQFFDGLPRRLLEPELQSLVLSAQRLDAAIAFVTRPGAALVRQFVKSRRPRSARLVASVRFPTNLLELAKLEDEFPGTVFLHLGFEKPLEPKADRAQFHSKIALFELAGNERCIVVGSHNWTSCGLEGLNLEAGVILRGQESDPIVAQAREHIEACIDESEPFDRERLRFYETIQRALHEGPGAPESDDFPGFEKFDSLVIHAEDATGGGMPEPVQLFVPVPDEHVRGFFPDRRRVAVFVYRAGTLHGKPTPTAAPRAYAGRVTMTNEVRDAPAGRQATCRLANLSQPKIELLPGRTIPPPGSEIGQVVIRLSDEGSTEVPVFHAGLGLPKIRLGIEVGPPRPDNRRMAPTAADARYTVPQHLVLRALLRVPSPRLYRRPIQQRLTPVLYASPFSEASMVPSLEIEPPAAAKVLNDFIYHVHYRITEESISRIEQQLPLFKNR